MKDTIKTSLGYKVVELIQPPTKVLLKDGNITVMYAKKRSYKDYIDECKNRNDETAEFLEIFTTIENVQFIYWRSNEFDEDFLTEVPQ